VRQPAAGGDGAASSTARVAEAFASKVEAAVFEGLFAGAALRVERRGLALFEGAWGDALRFGSERISMSPDTIFDIASITKLFTTTAVLRLISLGKLGLDTRLDEVPGLFGDTLAASPSFSPAARLLTAAGSLTIASLLSHSSGLHYWYPFYARRGEAFEAILADVIEEHPLRYETIYSDLNFMILGRVIEALSGKPLDEAVRDLVFHPLGLERTSWRRPLGPVAATEFGNRIEEGMVAALGLHFEGWRPRELPISGEPNDGNCHYYFGGAAGHAGVFCDLRDLCRLGRLYLDGGQADGEALIGPGLAAEALRDRGAGRGLGFQLGENYPGGGCGHTGFTGSYIHLNEASGLVIVLLANRLHVASPRDINPFRREVSALALALFGGDEAILP